MPMNRVQFQRGLSLPEFMHRYGTQEQCERALIAAHWPSGFTCPACGLMDSRSKVQARMASVLAMSGPPAPMQRHQRDRV